MFKLSSDTLPPYEPSSHAAFCAADVRTHAEANYKRAKSVKRNKDDSEETAHALLKLVNAVHTSAIECGDSSNVAQYALQRVSQILDMLDAILADTKKGFMRRRTVKRRLVALQTLVSLMKLELEVTLDDRRCGLIERDAHAATPGIWNLTHH